MWFWGRKITSSSLPCTHWSSIHLNSCLNASPTPFQNQRRECRTDVCWEWVTRRSCWRGDECPFLHIIVPVSDLPARFRWFIRKDNFPNSRQISPYKVHGSQFDGNPLDLSPACEKGPVLAGRHCCDCFPPSRPGVNECSLGIPGRHGAQPHSPGPRRLLL